MRTARKFVYRLEWLAFKAATKFLPLLSRKTCYRLALLLGSLGAMLDRRGRRVALSNLPSQARRTRGSELSIRNVIELFVRHDLVYSRWQSCAWHCWTASRSAFRLRAIRIACSQSFCPRCVP